MSMYSIIIIFLGISPPIFLFTAARSDKFAEFLSPLRVFSWVLIIGYSLKSLYLAYAVEYNLPFRTDHFTKDQIPIGQFMVISSVFGFIIGYKIVGRSYVHQFIRFSARHTAASLYFPVFIASISGVLGIFFLKDLGSQILSLQFSSAQYFVSEETGNKSALGFLSIGADFLVIYFLYYISTGYSIIRPNIYLPSILLVSIIYFLSSQRTGVLMIIVGSILVSRVRFFNLTSRMALKRIVIIILILVILSLASFIRSERRDVSASDLSISAGIEITLTHAFYGAYAIDPAKLAGINLRHQEYLMGESFLMFIIAPIPRILWPEKPAVRIGPYVAQEILEYNNNSGAPPSGIGELYMNFGLFGMIIGMSILGSISALIRNLFIFRGNDNFDTVRFAIFNIIMINFLIGDFSYAIITAIKYSFASWICLSYWRSKPRFS